MLRKRKKILLLFLVILSFIGLLYAIFWLSPTEPLPFIPLPLSPLFLFFPLWMLFLFSLITLIVKRPIFGALVAGLASIYLLFRLAGLTHPFFLFLLIALFVTFLLLLKREK